LLLVLVALLADLQHEFALARELQILAVLLAVAADPDEALVVNAHAVLVLRPVVAGAGTAPGLHQLAVLVELHDRRGWCTALAGGRIERRRFLVVGQAFWPLDHPDVVLRVDRNPRRLAHDPIVGQRPRPRRIDLKAGNVVGKGCRRGEGNG